MLADTSQHAEFSKIENYLLFWYENSIDNQQIPVKPTEIPPEFAKVIYAMHKLRDN